LLDLVPLWGRQWSIWITGVLSGVAKREIMTAFDRITKLNLIHELFCCGSALALSHSCSAQVDFRKSA
jgi:hypothetical protein